MNRIQDKSSTDQFGDKTIRQQTVASIDAVLDWHAIKSRDTWSARNSPFALKSSSYVAYIGKNSLNGLLCDRPIAWKRAAAFTLASLRRTWLTIASFHRPPSPVDDTMKLLKLSCGGGRELAVRFRESSTTTLNDLPPEIRTLSRVPHTHAHLRDNWKHFTPTFYDSQRI